ncbi:DUF427 domain-containing protein [soil metagenome]
MFMFRRRIRPRPGQESVWDFPRPPRIEPAPAPVRVVHNSVDLANSERALRVLETASPPTFYIPRGDVAMKYLLPTTGTTVCEFKGVASYFDLEVKARVASRAAWTYESPKEGFEELVDHVAFYAGRVDAAYVGDEKVTPQAGDFYGGWITTNVVGPFKGDPGTLGW